MDDYPYATLGADGWFRCDRLHHPGFPTLFRDMLHRFGYTGLPAYHGRLYRQFRLWRCKVHVDILAHPTDPTMTLGGNGARNAPAPALTTYSDFAATHPPLLTMAGEPLEADHWLWVMESTFRLLRCTKVPKTLFTV
jgi:hypothetical protein